MPWGGSQRTVWTGESMSAVSPQRNEQSTAFKIRCSDENMEDGSGWTQKDRKTETAVE